MHAGRGADAVFPLALGAVVLFTTIIASIAFPATAWLLDVPVP